MMDVKWVLLRRAREGGMMVYDSNRYRVGTGEGRRGWLMKE
jgi:hypothetical protein